MKRPSLLLAAVRAVLLAITASLFISCPMPLHTRLAEVVQARVEEYQRQQAPDILIAVGGVDLVSGSSTDAFAAAQQGSGCQVTFTLKNAGGSDLHLRDTDPISFTGADATLFSVFAYPASLTVAPGAMDTFIIELNLDSPGSKSAVINVFSDDPDESPYIVTVSNTALPEIQVRVGGTDITSGTGAYGFADTQYDLTRDVEFTIWNLGKANLDLTGGSPVSVSGSSYSVQSPPTSPITPGSSASFTIRLAPKTVGLCAGSVAIASSDGDESTYSLAVSGTSFLGRTSVRAAAGHFSGQHTLARKNDGTVWGWGYNAHGRIGDGTTITRSVPVSVPGLTSVAAISTNYDHSLALKDDGTVWAWGYNYTGQLGDGTSTTRTSPVQVSGLTNMVAVAAGGLHSVALKKDGTLWAWGNNDYRQMGDGTITIRYVPAVVTGLPPIVAVAAGAAHTLALACDGTLWAWGDNAHGQLCDGTKTLRSTPYHVTELAGVKAIASSQYHALALLENDTVRAWGWNVEGQLGDGSTTERLTPVSPTGLSNVQAVAAGEVFSMALLADGTVSTWGSNSFGQLGTGDLTDSLTPVQVPGLSGVVEIAAGRGHAIAVRSNATVWSWGSDYYGQVGDGGQMTYRPSPIQVSGFSGVVSIAAGDSHTVALKADGSAWAWGYDKYGQLGDGSPNDSFSLLRSQVAGFSGVAPISCGGYHTIALKSGGTLWTWGMNDSGQLGDGTTTDSPIPVLVLSLSNILAAAGGSSHTIVVKNDGTVWAWGNNSYGQLGNNSTTSSPTPVQALDSVGALSAVTLVAGGVAHTVALKSDGTVWAWGENTSGQLGDTSTTARQTAVQCGTLNTASSIAAGQAHTVVALSDGTVRACGSNSDGQIGDNTNTPRTSPVQVSGLTGVIAVAAGSKHSVALKSDGTVWCWGRNSVGQLGDGSTTDRLIPVQVAGLSGVAAIDAGGSFTVALLTDGSVRAWGLGIYLGYGFGDASSTPVVVKEDFLLW